MDTIQVAILISEIVYADPSPVAPIEFLPFKDILIITAILFGAVGCVILFRILYSKWKTRMYRRNPSHVVPTQKKNMTDYEKRMLADKINENRRDNLKKSFAGTVSSYGMIFATIGLIIIVLLWVAHLILGKFHK